MADEKIFTIPLKESFKKAEKKRTPYAARLVRSYLQTHMKMENVKIGRKLNEEIWKRGIRRPARNVRVKVIITDGEARAELLGFDYQVFKAQPKKEKKGMKDKLMERIGPKAAKKQEEEKKVEGTEKEEAKIEPAEAKPKEAPEIKEKTEAKAKPEHNEKK